MPRLLLSSLFALLLALAPASAQEYNFVQPYAKAAVAAGGGEITLVGSASANTANDTDVTVTLPVGTTTNDVVYVFFAYGDPTDRDVTTVTSGYTELADLFSNDNRDINFGAYRKVMGGSPDTQVVLDVPTATGNIGAAAAVYVLRGVDTTTPEDATTTTATGIDGSSVDPSSTTTVTDGAWVLAGAGWTNPAVPTAPTNYSNLVQTFGDDAQDGAIMSATRLITTAGAENPGVFGNTIGAGTDAWAAATVAVRPAP